MTNTNKFITISDDSEDYSEISFSYIKLKGIRVTLEDVVDIDGLIGYIEYIGYDVIIVIDSNNQLNVINKNDVNKLQLLQ